MSDSEALKRVHPLGEGIEEAEEYPPVHRVDTFGGPVYVEWSGDAGVSMQGPLTYFIEFLKSSGLWQRFVDTCPLRYTSRNAPKKEEVLGTILFSVLSGHRRYAHITAIRGDDVLPGVLGIETFRSEDSIRRAFEKQDEEELTLWIDRRMNETFEALLEAPWILDLDATVKTLYGRQEEARIGYNPHKPGRPSHVYHAMLLAAGKLVLNVDAHAGNQTASQYAQPALWGWLEARERGQWPTLVRGDIAHGNEEMMAGAEQRGLAYVFRLRMTKGVGRLIATLAKTKSKTKWTEAGQGWEAAESSIQLQGWNRVRRVVILRRRVAGPPEEVEPTGQLALPGFTLEYGDGEYYEHGALVTNWDQSDLLAIAQIYRDRGDAENMFDELKNQWGWTGFSTADLKRSQLMARIVALIFNWWSLFTRMATGSKHGEAITTRPLLQYGVARRTHHGNQTRLKLASLHGKAKKVANLLCRMSSWLTQWKRDAEQLEPGRRWPDLLQRIFRVFARVRFPSELRLPVKALPNCRI
jgi:hypothetical protein